MPILFSAVAHEKAVISKFASCDGNFMEIMAEVLSRIPPKNHKMTYYHGHYLFNYVVEDGYCYFCITSKTCQRSRAFLYLNEIKRRFRPRNKESFYQVLAAEMQRYSEDYNTIAIRKGELDELNGIGVDSSETILGEKILFVNNPERLTFSTITYVGGTPRQILLTENRQDEVKVKSKFKFYFVMLTVILILMWLGISFFGPTTFVIIACIFLLLVVRLSKAGNKS